MVVFGPLFVVHGRFNVSLYRVYFMYLLLCMYARFYEWLYTYTWFRLYVLYDACFYGSDVCASLYDSLYGTSHMYVCVTVCAFLWSLVDLCFVCCASLLACMCCIKISRVPRKIYGGNRCSVVAWAFLDYFFVCDCIMVYGRYVCMYVCMCCTTGVSRWSFFGCEFIKFNTYAFILPSYLVFNSGTYNVSFFFPVR